MIEDIIESHIEKARPLGKSHAEASWRFATTGRPEDQAEVARLSAEEVRLHRDRVTFERLREWDRGGAARDPLTARQVRLLHHAFAANQGPEEAIQRLVQLSVEVAGIYNNFRPSFEGKPASDNTLEQVLAESTDSDRCRAAWEARKLIGREVADRIRELARLRNRIAHDLGFPDHHTGTRGSLIDAARPRSTGTGRRDSA
ncbi:MAG: M2 family metallopeptidase [Planctomycetes bacterium]|nr:M2 family metallopeptidase [Planctomycetota bacterium]